MSRRARYLLLRCPQCAWTEHCGPEAAASWLRRAGKLRADRQPEPEILHEVLRATAAHLSCPRCGELGLVATEAPDGDAGWPAAVVCASCSSPISKERLEAVPGATLCAACQKDEEEGPLKTETEYCPRCGAPLQVRLSKAAGLTRYVIACTADPPCRL